MRVLVDTSFLSNMAMILWLPAKYTIIKKQPKSYLVNADASKTQQFQFVKEEEPAKIFIYMEVVF